MGKIDSGSFLVLHLTSPTDSTQNICTPQFLRWPATFTTLCHVVFTYSINTFTHLIEGLKQSWVGSLQVFGFMSEYQMDGIGGGGVTASEEINIKAVSHSYTFL